MRVERRLALGAALAIGMAGCAAPGADRPLPPDRDTRHELEMIECQQRAQNRPDEAQRLAECNHPRIGGG